MTREEASNILNDYDVNFDGHTAEEIAEAFDVAFRALEQEPILDRDCEHCSKTYGTLGCCTTVSNKWVYSCKEGQREYLLDKIRAEIQATIREEKTGNGNINKGVVIGLQMALDTIDKYKVESEDKE